MKTLKLESRQKRRMAVDVRQPSRLLKAALPGLQSDGPPHGATPEHMRLINALPKVQSIREGLGPLQATDVYVRMAWLANDQPFKDGRRRLALSSLNECVPLLYDKPVQINHATSESDDVPLGRWFDSAVVSEPDGINWLKALYYLTVDADNTQTVGRVDTGAVAESSIQLEFESFVCSICGESVGDCRHMPGEQYDGVTALGVIADVTDVWEGSLAWSGMIEGTRMRMAASLHSGVVPIEELEALAAAKQRATADPWRKFWATTAQGTWDGFWKEVGGAPAP